MKIQTKKCKSWISLNNIKKPQKSVLMVLKKQEEFFVMEASAKISLLIPK